MRVGMYVEESDWRVRFVWLSLLVSRVYVMCALCVLCGLNTNTRTPTGGEATGMPRPTISR